MLNGSKGSAEQVDSMDVLDQPELFNGKTALHRAVCSKRGAQSCLLYKVRNHTKHFRSNLESGCK